MEVEIILMAKVSWIKIETEMFNNSKIGHIRNLPEGNNIVLIWVMLLTMAGRCNANGLIFLTENIPYNEKMLADELRFDESVVRLALSVLEKFGMITRDGNLLTIPGWEEHQNIEGMDKIREQNRIRKQKQRERQRNMIEQDMSRDSSRDVTQQNKIKNKKEELDKDKEKDNNLIVSKDTIRQTDVRRVVEEWNKLQDVGIAPVTRMKSSSKRYKMLQTRIREYGIDDVIKAISKIRESDFLLGKKTDFIAKFDWFITPTYFPKILDGFYDNSSKEERHGKSNNTTARQATPLIPFDQWDGSNDSDTPFV
jgi:predicted phage replisome organizer|uniref:Replisome organizer n=1 Tax=Siphoviridae sp. ctEJG5 TaxID=2827814 RepID=A0A8S5RXM7_9CAUD|nr:MAG TPA: replisome organizer [Siphoviridae sp. ctEJG5]